MAQHTTGNTRASPSLTSITGIKQPRGRVQTGLDNFPEGSAANVEDVHDVLELGFHLR